MSTDTTLNLTTLGGLRTTLADLDPDARVYIDNRPPTALSSYRGFYDQLAIERRDDVRHDRTALSGRGEPFELNMAGYGTYRPGHNEVRITADPTVADVIAALDLADGEVFEGYKGGQFLMRPGTSLWVSEHGDVDRLRIVSVEVLPDRVDFATREEAW